MTPPENTQIAFGIRISLPKDDPFAHLIDESWHTIHWYPTQAARDLAMQDMCRKHEYSRHSDRPTLVFEGIEGTPS